MKLFTTNNLKKEAYMIKVSIIVPVYNPQGGPLTQAIESLMKQTYQNIEIILIDNASLNNNPQILTEYAKSDSRINLIRFEENQGFAGACNKGIEVSNGDYIQFVDSDDWLEPDSIEREVKRIQELNYPDILMFGAYLYDDKAKRLKREDKGYFWTLIPEEVDDGIFSYNDIKDGVFRAQGEAWSKIYKRDFIIKNDNKFDSELGSTCVDVFFNFNNYLNAETFGMLREHIYNYRININGSICSGLYKKDCSYVLLPLTFARKTIELMKKKKLSPEEGKPIVVSTLQLLSNLYKHVIHKNNKQKFYKACQSFFKNADKTYYNKENIKASGVKKWFYQTRNLPYPISCLLNIKPIKTTYSPTHKIYKIFGLKIKLKNKNKDFKLDIIIAMLHKQNDKINELKKEITELKREKNERSENICIL